MFKEIFLFELKYRLKRPATWIYFGLFVAMTFLLVIALGGAFGGNIIVGNSGGNGKVNSPYQINWIMTVLSWFGVLVTSAIMGNAIYRDFEYKTHPLFYTAPISKWGYLAGRFLGSFLTTLLVFGGIAVGYWLAAGIPWPFLDASKFQANRLDAYLHPYLLIIIPNLILTGGIFFTLATLTRNVLSTYIGSVLFLVLYGISLNLTNDLDNEFLAAMLDPFGASAINLTTRYWTPADRNNLLLPLSNLILLNRALWLGIGLLILAFCYKRFSFGQFASESVSKKKVLNEKAAAVAAPQRLILPKVQTLFSQALSFKQFRKLTVLELKGMIRNRYFIAIVAAGIIFLLANSAQVGKIYDTNTFPVTSEMIDFLIGTFTLFVLILITFYSGELVWRERDNRMNQMYDALPIPNWVPFASKLAALMGIQVVLMVVVMLCGIIVQTFKGYYNYELGLYIKELFGMRLVGFWLMCVLAMLVQVLVNNKYLGHFVMVIYYLVNIFKGQLGVEHNLWSYNSSPGVPYSAMNGFGHWIWGWSWFKLYWAGFALLLAVLSNLLWVRGTDEAAKWRFKLARLNLKPSTLMIAAAGLAIFLVSGGFIFYNTNVLNKYRSSKDEEKLRVRYEKDYKRFENLPQPRIVESKLNVDLYPKERDFRFRGYYWVKNKTQQPIKEVHLTIQPFDQIKKLEWSRPFTLKKADKDLGYYQYALKEPLAAGDSMQLNMDLYYKMDGFENGQGNTDIVYNGSFINSQYLPVIGYNEGGELSDDDDRKEYGLKPKERMAKITDLKARQNTYISSDADWIRFEATVSTEPDQIALAPGYLQKEWKEGDRRYFHYKMDAPILNFYSFLSAKYAIKRDKWHGANGQDVAIEVYYHPGHEYNLDRMIKSVKKSLDYFTANFSPYQHRQVRILEFPQYQTFAQSFPNTIPFSEGIGFVADVDTADKDDVDYPFYVTSHEVAHQWWAHQVIGGNVQGGTLMSETMSQYSALMVMKKEYGAERMKKFLKYEMNNYLSGRGFEKKKELPLYLVENQQYIHYRKGSVVMYALADYLGEDKVNLAMRNYILEVAFQDAPYTTSLDFMRHVKAVTPDSLQYLVTDMFEKITLYENKVSASEAKQQKDGTWKVTLTLDAKKVYADSLGNEHPTAMNDWIDVAVLAPEKDKGVTGKPLYFRKHRFKPGQTRLEVVVKSKPEKVGIDPYNKLIDRNPDDNLKKVEV